MAELTFDCPKGDGTITAKDEKTLIQRVHDHAHDVHGMHLDEAEIRKMMERRRE